MRIVHREQQRCLRLPVSDDAEAGQADQEEIGCIALSHAERHVERLALRIGTVIHPVEKGS